MSEFAAAHGSGVERPRLRHYKPPPHATVLQLRAIFSSSPPPRSETAEISFSLAPWHRPPATGPSSNDFRSDNEVGRCAGPVVFFPCRLIGSEGWNASIKIQVKARCFYCRVHWTLIWGELIGDFFSGGFYKIV